MNFSVEADKPSLLRSLSICFLFSFFAVHSALALYPNRRISEYAHTAWRIQDGFFGGTSIAQTKDGYIWIGTQSGLMRFDSVRFVPWSPPNGKHLPSQYIVSLLAGRDGSLWIGTAGGLSRRLDQNLINYPETTGWIESIFEDHEGKIWFTQVQADKIGGSLCQVVSSETRCGRRRTHAPRWAFIG